MGRKTTVLKNMLTMQERCINLDNIIMIDVSSSTSGCYVSIRSSDGKDYGTMEDEYSTIVDDLKCRNDFISLQSTSMSNIFIKKYEIVSVVKFDKEENKSNIVVSGMVITVLGNFLEISKQLSYSNGDC